MYKADLSLLRVRALYTVHVPVGIIYIYMYTRIYRPENFGCQFGFELGDLSLILCAFRYCTQYTIAVYIYSFTVSGPAYLIAGDICAAAATSVQTVAAINDSFSHIAFFSIAGGAHAKIRENVGGNRVAAAFLTVGGFICGRRISVEETSDDVCTT